MHQIHFLVESQNNFAANGMPQAPDITGQFADMVEVPAWNGDPNTPFPSVTLLMDFRGMDIGDFVYHCHILGHEDLGMMAIIQVLPASSSKKVSPENGNGLSSAQKRSTSLPSYDAKGGGGTR
jgi:FtsP/CotA-like multicopper oxidase with cupredoxin domain